MVALRKSTFEDEDTVETMPDTDLDHELADAVEWLKKAGIVSGEKPPFSGFFEELVKGSND